MIDSYIEYEWVINMGLSTWARRGLKPGDLMALKSFAEGGRLDEQKRVARLTARGFIEVDPDGELRITATGCLALAIKRILR